jgi:hypothetical protein
MLSLRPLLQSRGTRIVLFAVAALVMALPALYLFLLAAEWDSARKASKMLDRLERVRMDDPAANFEQAVRGCKLQKTSSGDTCIVYVGAFRFDTPWRLIARLPSDWDYKLNEALSRAGLRQWRLAVFSTVHDERIQSITVGFGVVGRDYEALGADWVISDRVPVRYYADRRLSSDQYRTYLSLYHITSVPSGVGFTVYATGASTENELRARFINRRCMFSFRGCDGLCELLPNAATVLKERKPILGDCGFLPRSRCELADLCRMRPTPASPPSSPTHPSPHVPTESSDRG